MESLQNVFANMCLRFLRLVHRPDFTFISEKKYFAGHLRYIQGDTKKSSMSKTRISLEILLVIN